MAQISHVVLVRWNADISESILESVRTRAQSLSQSIPGITQLAEGPSVSPEGLESGYEYALVIDFVDSASRDRYLTHPAHVPLAELLQANAASLVVFDVERMAAASR